MKEITIRELIEAVGEMYDIEEKYDVLFMCDNNHYLHVRTKGINIEDNGVTFALRAKYATVTLWKEVKIIHIVIF